MRDLILAQSKPLKILPGRDGPSRFRAREKATDCCAAGFASSLENCSAGFAVVTSPGM